MAVTISDLLIVLAFLFAIAAGVLYLHNRRLARMVSDALLKIEELRSSKQSLSTKYGRMTEMFIPLLDSYPYGHGGFRFIGSPVDGVQFEPDRIVFVEFKAGGSQLSAGQRQVRDLVAAGRVGFEVHRIPPVE